MKYYRREFFISRVCSGFVKIKHPKKTLKVYSPTIQMQYDVNEVYIEMYEQALSEGVCTDDDIYSFLIDSGKWTEKEEELLEELPKHIEKWQTEMYTAAISFKTNTLIKFRKYLARAREEFINLNKIRHQYYSYTCEGLAAQVRASYIIENCTKTLSNKKFKFNSVKLQEVLYEYNKNAITPEDLRLLARTAPWTNLWNAAKANGNPFNKYGTDLSSEQQLLLMWTKMYENISESPECPSEKILEDDDLLDGWLIVQRKKRMEEKGGGLQLSEKMSKADEVFLVAETNPSLPHM